MSSISSILIESICTESMERYGNLRVLPLSEKKNNLVWRYCNPILFIRLYKFDFIRWRKDSNICPIPPKYEINRLVSIKHIYDFIQSLGSNGRAQ